MNHGTGATGQAPESFSTFSTTMLRRAVMPFSFLCLEPTPLTVRPISGPLWLQTARSAGRHRSPGPFRSGRQLAASHRVPLAHDKEDGNADETLAVISVATTRVVLLFPPIPSKAAFGRACALQFSPVDSSNRAQIIAVARIRLRCHEGASLEFAIRERPGRALAEL